MKKLTWMILVMLLSVNLPFNAQATNPKYGEPCLKLNQQKKFQDITYVCSLVNAKLVWTGMQYTSYRVNTAPQADKSINTKTKPKIKKPSHRVLGGECYDSNETVNLPGGILYCVQIADGTFKFVEQYKEIPILNNPSSPNNVRDCMPPDLRGPIPENNMGYAITYPPIGAIMQSSGTLNMQVVPIDFPDFAGNGSPTSIYSPELNTLAKWFNFYSNGKFKLNISYDDTWTRAKHQSSFYNIGEAVVNNASGVGEQELMQEFVDSTSNRINFKNVDIIQFVYPSKIQTIEYSIVGNKVNLNANGSNKSFIVLSTSKSTGVYEKHWMWNAHELLHRFGLAIHSPVNPPRWGVESGAFTHSETLLPWNQAILDWINPDQYYCVHSQSLLNTKLTLVPLEREESGLRSIFIRVSNNESLLVVSHKNGEWSYQMPKSYYGTMVALIDTTKQVDYSGEHTNDPFDGVKYSKPGVWLHPDRKFHTAKIWNRLETNDWGANMLLGDSVTYKGVTIKLVSTDNYDTVEISKS